MEAARWWAMRPAQNLKPASYVCPLCDGMLHATSEHALIAPEGDLSRRRHAHMECVLERGSAASYRRRTSSRSGAARDQRRLGLALGSPVGSIADGRP